MEAFQAELEKKLYEHKRELKARQAGRGGRGGRRRGRGGRGRNRKSKSNGRRNDQQEQESAEPHRRSSRLNANIPRGDISEMSPQQNIQEVCLKFFFCFVFLVFVSSG